VEFLGIGQQPFNLAAPHDPKTPTRPPMTLGNCGFNAHLRRNLWLALWLAALNLALAFVLFLMQRQSPFSSELRLWRKVSAHPARNMREQGFCGVIANQRKRLGARRRTCG
jgi:hypothetical protein